MQSWGVGLLAQCEAKSFSSIVSVGLDVTLLACLFSQRLNDCLSSCVLTCGLEELTR